jgi:tetratricopeptide (TPR) repeat protein
MKTTPIAASLLLVASISAARADVFPSSAQAQPAPQAPAASAGSQSSAATPGNQDAFYYFMLGHLGEQDYDAASGATTADDAIANYKKALELSPGSPVILERLAEIYAKSQHTREAVATAQEALKADAKNVEAHRLLAFIYYRALGDPTVRDLQQQNLDKAIEQFQAILSVDPRDLNASLMLARLYGFENKHDDAEKILRSVLARYSENGPALEQLSQLLLEENRWQEAIGLLKQAALNSEDPGIYDLLGDAYSQAKQYPAAESAYRKAIEGDPDDPGHIHGLADALLGQDKYADALKQFQRLAALEPASANNYLRMAELYRRLGQFTESRSSLEHAKHLAPGNLEIVFSEALLDEDQGRPDDALELLNAAISDVKTQSAGENASALSVLYEQLGRVHLSQRNYPGAIAAYRSMQTLSPDSRKRAQMLVIDAYRQSRDIDRAIEETKAALMQSLKDRDLTTTLALLYGDKSDVPTGVKLLQSLLQGNAADQEIYIDIAEVQERGKQFAEAEQSAQKAEQMANGEQERASARFMLGVTYERQKKFDLAEEQFRKVLEAEPENASVLNYYGYMLANRGVRLEEATGMIKKAVDSEPNNGAYLDSLGWAYFKADKLPEAEEYLRKAVDREGNDPTILSHLGDVYLKTGQNERAAAVLERSVAMWQKVTPSEYEAEKANETETKLRNLKKRLAQKTSPSTDKPQ